MKKNDEWETRAQHLRDRHGHHEVPVDVAGLLRDEGIALRYESFPDDGVSAMLYRAAGNDVAVIVNDGHHPNRQRFSIAHELGHYELHENQELFVDGQATVHFRDHRAAAGTHKQERDANAFAASLLMPEAQLKERFDALSQQETRQPDELIAAELARQFQVSEQAMMLRLLNLALIVSV